MQRKLPSHCLSPSICALCMADNEDLQHQYFDCYYAEKCWLSLFSLFDLCWVFGSTFRDNILQVLVGPSLKPGPKLLWSNTAKALFAELWFERKESSTTNQLHG